MSHSIEKLHGIHWDAIVIGSGVGGATAAYSLAQKGKKVLVLERGPRVESAPADTRLGLWQQRIFDTVKERSFLPFLGEGVGGSSRFFGMVMERPHISDFSNRGGAWPESLESWIPYFSPVEMLFQCQPAPIPEEFSGLVQHLSGQMVNVRRLHLSRTNLKSCEFCQGRYGGKRCKVDAWTGPLKKALEFPTCSLVNDVLVLRVLIQGERATAVEVEAGQLFGRPRFVIQANQVFVAGGALRTPFILKNSGVGTRGTALGRYLMRHLIDLYSLRMKEFSSFDSAKQESLKANKCLGWSDFYLRDNKKLGVVQSFGSFPHPSIVLEELYDEIPFLKKIPGFSVLFPKITDRLFSTPLLASIVEDEARSENFIDLNSDQADPPDREIRITYQVSEGDREKIRVMRELVRTYLGPYYRQTFKQAENNHRLAHACGTARMGKAIENSVVDFSGRVHEVENLYVVDASVFPSSLGTNPSLMIAAHALRTVERALGHV